MARRSTRPSTTPEGRESQLVSEAMDLAARQFREGTAPAQVQIHFLKLGTEREKLERAKLERENLLLEAKVESIKQGDRIERMYAEALTAMREYRGDPTPEEGEEGYDAGYG